MVIDLDGLHVVVYDSTAPNDNIATNAFGCLPQGVLQRLVALLTQHKLAEQPCVHALHHQVLSPLTRSDDDVASLPGRRASLWSRFATWFLMLANPDAFIDALSAGADTMV